MWLDKRLLLSFAVGLSLVCTAFPASAETAVLELFTSQGCSSCPPADRLFKDLSARPGLVALSFNVDYWDYLGWKDTLAQRTYSDRQRTYARLRGDGAVYTPQIVVNGLSHAIGSMPAQIKKVIATTEQKLDSRRVPLTVGSAAGTFTITIGQSDHPPPKAATVLLASVRPKVTVRIRHGENRGRTLSYYNVVANLSVVGMWAGRQKTIELPRQKIVTSKEMRCAVLIQADDGAMIAASWLPSSAK